MIHVRIVLSNVPIYPYVSNYIQYHILSAPKSAYHPSASHSGVSAVSWSVSPRRRDLRN